MLSVIYPYKLRMSTEKRKKIKKTKDSRLDLRMTDDFRAELEVFAEKKGLSLTAIITLWLKERLEAEKG